MAVIAVWKCDRDGAMFDNKKEAEEHDKMLELAENISSFLKDNINDIDDQISNDVGILLAKNRDSLAKACKGKPEVLLSIAQPATEDDEADSSVTPLPVNS